MWTKTWGVKGPKILWIFLADLCGVLVDRDTNAEVWLLQGLDITKRIGELAP